MSTHSGQPKLAAIWNSLRESS